MYSIDITVITRMDITLPHYLQLTRNYRVLLIHCTAGYQAQAVVEVAELEVAELEVAELEVAESDRSATVVDVVDVALVVMRLTHLKHYRE